MSMPTSRSLRTRPATLYAREGLSPNLPQTPAWRKASRESEKEDKVRNRLSTRYASGAVAPGLSYMSGLNTLAPIAASEEGKDQAVPPLPPAIDTQVVGSSQTATAATTPAGTSGVALAADVFSDDNFDARTFASEQMQQLNEPGLRNLRTSLGTLQSMTQKQLKEQVFKNYAEFITISREIATFENDMLEFKEILGEWKQLPQQLQMEDPLSETALDGSADSGIAGGVPRRSRNSMIDLEQIYKAQLTSLWENIEGSQKFVPLVHGRHLVAETSQFVEINAATYKPKQAVALFLLDDLLLIAVQRKRHYGNRIHLVAECCFNLSEIVVVDLKDSKDVRNAIKIKHGRESFVYRSERAQDKRALLRAFRGVGEELAAKLKKQRKARSQSKHMGSDNVLYGSESMDPASQDLGLSDQVPAAPTSTNDVQWLGPWLNGVIDELAVHIALREWEEAVTLVEEGKKRLASRPISEGPLYLLVESFNSCASELVQAISAELASPYQRKSMVVRDAALLVRLDKGREARDLLLEARTDLLQRRMRQIKYEGDVSLYISELAMLYFTLIKNTGDWYMAAFKDYRMASGFVQWASDQVKAYAETFRRQVYGVEQDPRVVDEALDITRRCAQLLNEVGLGLGFLLDDLLKPGVEGIPLGTWQDPALSARDPRQYQWHSTVPA